MLVAACSDDEPVDPVQAAQARVSAAQEAVNKAQTALDEATAKFCEESKDYILAVDRYGKALRRFIGHRGQGLPGRPRGQADRCSGRCHVERLGEGDRRGQGPPPTSTSPSPTSTSSWVSNVQACC